MNKLFASAAEAVKDIPNDVTIMSGGFGLCGNPEDLIRAIHAHGITGLTVISNNCGVDGKCLGLLLGDKQIKKMISSYVGENKTFESQFLSGELEVELTPQCTHERIRAGGAGVPAFFTPTGFGTVVAEGKETREFNGVNCVMETGLTADYALVKAWKGDAMVISCFVKPHRNFNPMMATAAKVTIAEVEEFVPAGELDADMIHTPGIFVQRVIKAGDYEKPIEQRTITER